METITFLLLVLQYMKVKADANPTWVYHIQRDRSSFLTPLNHNWPACRMGIRATTLFHEDIAGNKGGNTCKNFRNTKHIYCSSTINMLETCPTCTLTLWYLRLLMSKKENAVNPQGLLHLNCGVMAAANFYWALNIRWTVGKSLHIMSFYPHNSARYIYHCFHF